MVRIRILERVEILALEGGSITGHIGNIGRVIIREGELGLLIGDGELAGLAAGDETVGDAVVIRAEHDAVRIGGEGHLIALVADDGPLEVLGRNRLVHATGGGLEITPSTIYITADQRHRDLRRGQQLDAVPLDGVRDVLPTAHRDDDLAVR